MPLWSPRQSKSTWRPGDEWRGAGSDPSHSRPTGFPKPFRILDALTATQTQQLAESPRWFPDLWSKSYCERRGQVEATRTATTYKTKAMLHSWRECQHYCHHRRLEATSLCHSPAWTGQGTDGAWRMTLDYHKPDRVTTPRAAATSTSTWFWCQANQHIWHLMRGH